MEPSLDLPISLEILNEHGRFARRLARALLTDPARAEDVAQEALARWTSQPPGDRSRPRAWLGTVVRRLAWNVHRSDERRSRHERAAAREEAVAGSTEEVDRSEVLQQVFAAVQALEPELRTIVLARFYRGLETREIAAECGLSEDVVRARERRALAMLRQRLDREHGRRALWAAPLARSLPFRRRARRQHRGDGPDLLLERNAALPRRARHSSGEPVDRDLRGRCLEREERPHRRRWPGDADALSGLLPVPQRRAGTEVPVPEHRGWTGAPRVDL